MKTPIQQYINKRPHLNQYEGISEQSLDEAHPLMQLWKDEHRYKLITIYAQPTHALRPFFHKHIQKQPIKKSILHAWLHLYSNDEIGTLQCNRCSKIHILEYLVTERGQHYQQWIETLDITSLIEMIPLVTPQERTILADTFISLFTPENNRYFYPISRFKPLQDIFLIHRPEIINHIFKLSSAEEQFFWLYKNYDFENQLWISNAYIFLQSEYKKRNLSNHFLSTYSDRLIHMKYPINSVLKEFNTYKKAPIFDLPEHNIFHKNDFLTYSLSGKIEDLLEDWKNLCYSSTIVSNIHEVEITL